MKGWLNWFLNSCTRVSVRRRVGLIGFLIHVLEPPSGEGLVELFS